MSLFQEIDEETACIISSGVDNEQSRKAFYTSMGKSNNGYKDHHYGVLTSYDLPERGWKVDRIERESDDLTGGNRFECERCEKEDIQYKFFMTHPAIEQGRELVVGCVCAGWMFGTPDGIETAKKMRIKAAARIKKREVKKKADQQKRIEEDKQLFSNLARRKYAIYDEWLVRDRELQEQRNSIWNKVRKKRKFEKQRPERVRLGRNLFISNFKLRDGWVASKSSGNPTLYKSGFRHTIYEKQGYYCVVSVDLGDEHPTFHNGRYTDQVSAAGFIFDRYIATHIE